MGTPALTAIGLAASAAGTGVSIAAAQQAKQKMNEIVRQQLESSQEFQQRATPEFQKSLGVSDARAAQAQIAAGVEAAKRGYEAVQGQPSATAPSPILGDALIEARTRSEIAQRNAAQAALQGYGNMTLQQWLANEQARQNLGVIAGLAGSRAAITPYQLQGAQQDAQSLSSIGSLLGTAGSLTGVYGSLYPYLNQPKQPVK